MNDDISDRGLTRLAYIEAIGDIHRQFVEGVLDLFDGFMANLEDALFEEAVRSQDERERDLCAGLLRSARDDDASLRRVFASMLQRSGRDWLAPRTGDGRIDDEDTDSAAIRLAAKTTSHMGGMLRLILNRYNAVSGHAFEQEHALPVSPYRIAVAWTVAAQVRYPDPGSVAVLGRLFERFVLMRLNGLYGQMQVRLAGIVRLDGDIDQPAATAA